jgi:hypothetical protein
MRKVRALKMERAEDENPRQVESSAKDLSMPEV